MKFSRLMLFVVMALLTSAESGAALTSDDNIYSGNDLLAACAMAEEVNPSDEAALGGRMGEVVLNSLRSGMCVGHVAGLMYLVSRANLGICVPEQATEGQGLSVVVRYMRQHPEELREDFRSIILSAMRTAWPCRL